jgi:glycosyltransferase involved in cell wall biosynthesis
MATCPSQPCGLFVKSIGLCLIAKNEAHVITRCIESARPLIDYVLVVDTGSTDDTPRVVREYLKDKGLAGEVIHEPWRDFAYNRNVALSRMREHAEIDYSLMLDADQVLVFEEGFNAERFNKKLRHDLYDLRLRGGSVEFLIPNLASNRINIFYKAVLHEYREVPSEFTRGFAKGFHIRETREGGRSSNSDKYRDDAVLLENALREEGDPFLIARYKFYLAQSYRDCGESEKAIQYYLERTKLDFWEEEIFLSYVYAGRLQASLNRPGNEILETFLAGQKICPWRAEALHGAAQLCRIQGNYHLGYMLALPALRLPNPNRGLFIETWIYEYALLDEFAVLCYWTGRYQECIDAAARILREEKIPEQERARVQQNADFAAKKLKAMKSSSLKQK